MTAGAPLATLQLLDPVLPALGAGDYVMTVKQTDPAGVTASADQLFSVRGPRYTLPAGEVASVFPPAGSRGEFEGFLPHVVLRTPALPWEQDLFGTTQPSGVPWLALLLLDPGDIVGTSTVTADAFYATPRDPSGLRWPNLSQEWFETNLSSTVCAVVDITSDAFAAVVPSRGDLAYLAHGRVVTTDAKATGKGSTSGEYAVVIGNRLPDPPAHGVPGALNTVHLVSLEGYEDLIGTSSVTAPGLPARLISLASWSFTCLPEGGEGFTELVTGLVGPKGQPSDLGFVLPLPPPGEDDSSDVAFARRAIADGFVPLPYRTRSGGQTMAWYRGPLTPVPVEPFLSSRSQGPDDPAGWTPLASPSAGLVYDPARGVFDVSYSVAFETGRLLALADGAFARALLGWQRDGHALIDLVLERAAQLPASGQVDLASPAGEQELLQLLAPGALTQGFAAALLSRLTAEAPEPDATAGAVFPPAPVPKVSVANPQTLADLLTAADVQAAVQTLGGQRLGGIDDVLARLLLLDGVPFENLVPHPLLLPTESLRCFFVDANWLAALFQGALSIAIGSSRDALYQDLMKDLVWDSTLTALQGLRAGLLGTAAEAGTVAADASGMAGMLIRSALVSGWPGLEVRASDAAAAPIPLLRMERLSGDVMLCLWPTIPTTIQLAEPSEGIAFGLEDTDAGDLVIDLRSVTEGTGYGTVISGRQRTITPDAHRVVSIATLATQVAGDLDVTGAISVHDLALQLLKAPEMAVITTPTRTTRSDP